MLPKRKPLYKDVWYLHTQDKQYHYSENDLYIEYQSEHTGVLNTERKKNNYWIILFVEVEKVIQITKSFAEFSWK